MNRFAVGLLALSFAASSQAQDLTPEKKEFFENHIRPVLAQQCFACHTNSMMAGLRLDSREGILKGGVYHVHKGLGVDESVMWGEFFFCEALERVLW